MLLQVPVLNECLSSLFLPLYTFFMYTFIEIPVALSILYLKGAIISMGYQGQKVSNSKTIGRITSLCEQLPGNEKCTKSLFTPLFYGKIEKKKPPNEMAHSANGAVPKCMTPWMLLDIQSI